jgi:hypothetical protein
MGTPVECRANIEILVATVLVDHPRLGRVRMNTADYDPATCGPRRTRPAAAELECVSPAEQRPEG